MSERICASRIAPPTPDLSQLKPHSAVSASAAHAIALAPQAPPQARVGVAIQVRSGITPVIEYYVQVSDETAHFFDETLGQIRFSVIIALQQRRL